MTDVVLIEPAYYDNRKKKNREQPQLGLGYIASYLEMQGVGVEIIDAAIDDLQPGQIARQVKDRNPLVVGITGCSDDRLGMIETIESVRKECPDVLIAGGGPHFAYTAVDALSSIAGLDVVVIGEGEQTMHELVAAFSSDRSRADFEAIPGIAYRLPSGQILSNPMREPIKDLDSIPAPAWHLFDMDKYQGFMTPSGPPYRAIGVISSRGCPFSCSFCANSLSKKVRYRAPSLFVDEVEYLMDRYGFEALNFQDDSFTANSRHVRAICEEILSRKISLKWFCSLRLDQTAKHRDLLVLMKEAGCISLGFGVEFPANEVLKSISKKVTVETMEMAFRNVADVGFEDVALFLINSLPGQTRENTIEAQLNLRRFQKMLYGKTREKVISGSWTLLYPGTHLTRIAEEEGNVFAPGFSWNTYYKNPYSEFINLTHWSMPTFENRNFTISEIIGTQQEMDTMLKLRASIKKRSIKDVVSMLGNPKSWKDAYRAAGLWREVRANLI